MSKGKTIKFKLGDCFKTTDFIGKIVDVKDDGQPVLWATDIIAKSIVMDPSYFYCKGGLIRYTKYFSPLWLSKNCQPATEEDYLKALKILQLGEISFDAILKKDNSVTL